MMRLEVTSPSTRPTGPSTELLPIASSVPIGQSGLVHIWGRNDASVPRHMGIQWVVKDPDGVVVEDYEDWVSVFLAKIELDPGDDHEFIGGRFDLDKEGTYTIAVSLLMNPDSPVVVDSYEGDLCTTTLEVPPEFELIQHTVYPYAYVYDGKTDFSIFTCKTPSFIPAGWAANKFAEAVESEVEKAGGRVIDLKVYADMAGPFGLWDNFRIEVEGTPLGAAQGVGVPVGIPLWATILIIALSIALLIVVITWSIDTITKSFTHKPINEEIKKAMSPETLIRLIGDLEVKLEHPLTPVGELEQMSDEELRVYCDSLAEVIVPPVPSWLPWAIIGGVVVVGGGAAALLLTRRE
ncbi:hypothetical protein ES703_94468 [subsurface metagenome]